MLVLKIFLFIELVNGQLKPENPTNSLECLTIQVTEEIVHDSDGDAVKQRIACSANNNKRPDRGSRNTLQSLKDHVNTLMNITTVSPAVEASRRSKFEEFLKLSRNEKNGRIAEFCWKFLLHVRQQSLPFEKLKMNLSRCEKCRR